MPVRIEGYLIIPKSHLAAVMEALPHHIELTRQEQGCVSFEVTQNADNPNRLDVAEVFRDQAAFEFHQQRSRTSPWWEVSSAAERHFEIKNTENSNQ